VRFPDREQGAALSAWEAGLAARFAIPELPAMGWHYWGRHSAGHGPAPCQHKQKAPTKAVMLFT